jgi:hypothetical protein
MSKIVLYRNQKEITVNIVRRQAFCISWSGIESRKKTINKALENRVGEAIWKVMEGIRVGGGDDKTDQSKLGIGKGVGMLGRGHKLTCVNEYWLRYNSVQLSRMVRSWYFG